MPELPDVTIYREALEARVLGHTLDMVRLANPFVLRTVDPSPVELAGSSPTRALSRLLHGDWPKSIDEL